MAARIAGQIYHSASFQTTWKRALEEYQSILLPEELDNVNLYDPAWEKLESVEDLVGNLAVKQSSFNEDRGRDTVYSGVVKNSLRGFQTLIDMFGGAAGSLFPPCSQILGAVSVLLHAGEKVSGAFDEVSGLFAKVGDFLVQLRVLSEVEMEPPLQTCVTNILVCTLRICGVATRKMYHDETIEQVKEGHTIRRIWKKTKQKTKSTGTMYFRQLFLGDDPDIREVVSKLQGGVEAQQKMLAALTKNDTGEIRSMSIYIAKLDTEIYNTTVGIQTEIHEIQGRVVEIQGGVQQLASNQVEIESGVGRLQSGQARLASAVTDAKGMMSRVETRVVDGVDELKRKQAEDTKLIVDIIKSGGQAAARPGNALPSKAAKQLSDKLSDALHPAMAFKSVFAKFTNERVPGTSDWILEEALVSRWLDQRPDKPVLVISGKNGSGKTFLATRIVETLQEKVKSAGTDRSPSLAYFFCRKNPQELASALRVLSTLAFQISEVDSVYTSHLSAENRMKIIKKPDGVKDLWDVLFVKYFRDNPSRSAMLVLDGIDECGDEELQSFVEGLRECIEDSKWTLPNVHLLLLVSSGKSDPDRLCVLEQLTDALGDCGAHLTVDAGRTADDLDLFVTEKLKEGWKDRLVPDRLRDHVHGTVRQHCQGDFLRTSLILEEVTSLSREDDIWALLSRPPRTVTDATSLVLRRLCRRLDKHDLEDLIDMFAWISCQHTPLSLATLDAILTIRNYEGSRLINLKQLVTKTYSALFITSPGMDGGNLRSENEVRGILGLQNSEDADTAGQIERTGLATYKDDLLAQYPVASTITSPDKMLKEMENIQVRLADTIADQPAIVAEALTAENLACKTLLGCLKVMCDPPDTVEKEAAGRASKYCALFFPEHLQAVVVGEVDAKRTREIVRLLLKVLRDKDIIDRWIAVAFNSMTSDLLASASMEERLLMWLQSPDIQGRLPLGDLEWIKRVVESPTELLFQGIARGHAHRWLTRDKDSEVYANYDFVNTYVSKIETCKPKAEIADSAHGQNSADVQDESAGGKSGAESDTSTKSLYESSAEDICHVAEWANLPKDARWHRRLGYALYLADKNDAAVEHYTAALDADADDPPTHHCLGSLYMSWGWDYYEEEKRVSVQEKAIPHLSRAVELYEKKIVTLGTGHPAKAEDEQACSCSRYFLALIYGSVKKPEEAGKVYESIVAGWQTRDFDKDEDYVPCNAACIYIDTLIESTQDENAITLLNQIVQHRQSRHPSYIPIYRHHLYSSDQLLQLAHRTEQFQLINKFWENATFVLACRGDEGEVAEARWRHAHAIARLCAERRDDAIVLLRMASCDPDAEHWTVDKTEKELARLYLDLALESRDDDKWSDVDKFFRALNSLVHKDNNVLDSQSYKDNESTLFIASWYRLHRRFGKARLAVKRLLERQVDLLYDEEPDNDESAWYRIANVCLAVGDEERARAATNMKGSIAAYKNKTNIVTFADSIESGDVKQESDEVNGHGSDENGPISAQAGLVLAPPDKKCNPDLTQEESGEAHTASQNPAADDSTPDNRPISIKENEPVSNHTLPNGTTLDHVESGLEKPSPPEKNEDNNGSSGPPVVSVVGANDDLPPNPTTAVNGDSVLTEPPPEDGPRPDVSRGYTCDGPCFNTSLPADKDLFRCTICSRDFCSECHEKVKSGDTKGFYICNSAHEWVCFPPVERCQEGTIRVDGKDVPILDWLDCLALAWGIEQRARGDANGKSAEVGEAGTVL